MSIKPITVYAAEKEAGLEHKIRSQSSIAFTAPVASHDPMWSDEAKATASQALIDELTEANVDDPDVHHVFSILVSTVWNKNDDVFDKDEVWAARNTPRFKPTNIEHDEKQIVGGITSSWPINADLSLMTEETEAAANDEPVELPDLYHLLVASVIYKQWQDPELQARATELIQAIDDGNKFVSMECIFHGFDFGVVAPDGQNHILARSEDTAFLSQHLRAYGGTGTFQGHKIGRVLRNITFSGKGFVDKPANPDSIIFDRNHIFSFANVSKDESLFLNENGVNTDTEDNSFECNTNKESMMSDQNDQIKELKETLATLTEENKELNNKLAAANVSQFEDKIVALEADVVELTEAKTDLEGKLTEANTTVEGLKSDLSTTATELNEIQANFEKMRKEEKKKKRHASLVEAGLSADEADAKLEAFESLNDEQFDAIVQTVSELKPVVASDDVADEEHADEAAADTDEVVEDAEASEEADSSEVVESDSVDADTSMASTDDSEEDELSTARAGLSQWVEDVVLKSK